MENKVSIVIPNYNGKAFLKDCLRSLKKQTYPAKVYIIDNGSSDGSLDIIRDEIERLPDKYPEIVINELSDNTGFANAVNVGIKMTDTEYVILLNNDTVSDERMTEKLLRAIESRKKVFSVGAKMLSMKNPDIIDDSGDLYCALGWGFSPGRDKNAKSYSKTASVTSACAGAAIYRKAIFDEIGYFDDAHFCYLEDVDIGYRAKIYGYKNIFEPKAIVYHAGSGTSGSRYNEFKEELTVANNLYFLYKNLPILQLVINLPLIIAGILIKFVYFSKKKLGRSYVKGLAKGFGKITKYSDRKVPFEWGNFPNYIGLEVELLVNCIRRLVG